MNRILLLVITSLSSLAVQAQSLKPIEHPTCKSTASGIIVTLGASAHSLAKDPFNWENSQSLGAYFRAKGFEISGRYGAEPAKDGDLNTHIGLFCEQDGRYAPRNCKVTVVLSRTDSTAAKGSVVLATSTVRRSFSSTANLGALFDEEVQRAGDRIPICNQVTKN